MQDKHSLLIWDVFSLNVFAKKKFNQRKKGCIPHTNLKEEAD